MKEEEEGVFRQPPLPIMVLNLAMTGDTRRQAPGLTPLKIRGRCCDLLCKLSSPKVSLLLLYLVNTTLQPLISGKSPESRHNCSAPT